MKNWFRKKQNEGHYQPILQEDEEEKKFRLEEELAEEDRRRRKLDELLTTHPLPSASDNENMSASEKKDPLYGAKFTSKDIFTRLLHAAEDTEHRVNCLTLLLFASGLAGYACQAVVWEDQKQTETSLFLPVQGENGKTYLYGAAVDKYLLDGKNSVWNMTVGVFQKRHPELECPKLDEIGKRVSDGIGKADYAYFDVSDPEQYMHHYHLMWQHEKTTLKKNCDSPAQWPLVFSMVLQYALQFSDHAMNPVDAFAFSMENAIFAARPDQSKIEATQKNHDVQ